MTGFLELAFGSRGNRHKIQTVIFHFYCISVSK